MQYGFAQLVMLLLPALTQHLVAADKLYIKGKCNHVVPWYEHCHLDHELSKWRFKDDNVSELMDSNDGCHKTGPFQAENSEFCIDWTVDGGRGHYRFPWMAKPRCLAVGHREPRDCPGAKDGSWDCYYWVLNEIECTWWTGDP